MKTPQSLFIVPSLLLALAAAPRMAAAGDFVIAQNGHAKAVVVVEGGVQSNGVTYAANVLADFLGRLSGTHFMVASKPVAGYNTIRVGVPYRPSKPEELRLRVVDDRTLEVTGDGPRGTMHAVSELLERLGVVFCAHDYDYVPSRATLSLTNGFDVVDAPFMTWRDSWTELQRHHPLFMMKLRLTPGEKSYEEKIFDTAWKPNIDQNMCTHYVNRDKFLKDHADWYAYVAKTGKRNPHWVCVSSEGMYQELFREIEAELAKDPQIREISVGVDDGYSMCECANCLKQLDAARDPDGAEVGNLQYVILANRVGRHFEKSHPNVRFNLLAYDAKMPSNPKVMFNKNVGAGVAELWRNHGLPADCNERSACGLGNVARMSAPQNGPYIWDYLANFGDYTIPYPNHRIFAQTARYYKRLGVKGARSQLAFTLLNEMGELKMWLYAKLLWNPDADVDQLISTYVKAAYGAGAREVQEYLDRLEHARLRQRWTWYGCYVRDTAHYLSGDDCLRLVELVDQAERQTRNDEPRHRIVCRLRLATLNLAITRYDDMLAAAEKRQAKLRPFAKFFDEWVAACETEGAAGHDLELGEGSVYDGIRDRRYRPQLALPHKAASYPRAKNVYYAAAKDLTGGQRLTRGKDADGTDYARFRIDLKGERENYFMNPEFAEAGWTIPDAAAGEWYVFATTRTATTVDYDVASYYAGVYQPWFMNGKKTAPIQEVVERAVPAKKGETGWTTLCLGKRVLYPESRVWVMPGILHQSDYTDTKEIFLLAPDVVEKGVDGVSSVIPGDRVDRAGVKVEQDRVDRFNYARSEGAPLKWTVGRQQAGRWLVLVDVRANATRALDPECATVASGDAKAVVTGSEGDEAWQGVSLGVLDLKDGATIVVTPRTAGDAAPRSIDVRRIVLVNPAALK